MYKVKSGLNELGWKATGVVFGVLSTAATALAQSGIQEVEGVPLIDGSIGIRALVGRVVNIVLWAAGVVAVLYLIWGGLTYITAGGESEKASKGRVAITNAIIGIVIIAAALVIYNSVIGAINSSTGTVE